MLTRNCEKKQTNLIYPKDFNIRVTVYDKNPKYYVKEAYYLAWINTIINSLGKSILNSEEVRSFIIKRPDWRNSYLTRKKGKDLPKTLKAIFQKPVSFRIETVEENPKVWVFYLEKDI